MKSTRRFFSIMSIGSLTLLAGCGIFGKQVSLEMTDEDKQRCPAVGIVAYTGEITNFALGDGRTTDDVVSRGTISELRVNCFNTATGVDATVSFDVSVSTGPAGVGQNVGLSYFVALTDWEDKMLEKKLYVVSVPTSNGYGTTRQFVGIQVPFEDGEYLVDQEVVIGFHLSREQLTYNIQR